ncbi:insulinase family protein, partial [Patescibacteria group bacterium]|nr:insulinase family protein [Patescibacteria group bacterium]
MNYKLTKLSNDLRVIVVPMANLESATITVWVGVGSRYETFRVGGISHFLEHIVFKGSKKRPSAREISTAIDSFGGEFNASTSKEWTNFYIRARTGKMETAMDVLSDMVLNPILRPADIEREKGVILEEMAMYEDTPVAKIGDYFERLVFSGNSLGRDIVGSRETVKKINKNDFVSYRNTHYGSSNVVVTIAGGITNRRAIDLAEKYFAGLETKPKTNFKKFTNKQKKPKIMLVSKKIEQAHLVLGFLGNKRMHKDRFAEVILTSILGGGMSSRMFTEVREKRGLAYAVQTSSDHSLDTGYLSTYVGADVARVDETIKVVLDQYFGIADGRFPITKKELVKAKEYVKGHLALSLESTTAVNHFVGIKELLDGKIETPEDVYKDIDKVSVGDIVKVANEFFVPSRMNMAITGPYK